MLDQYNLELQEKIGNQEKLIDFMKAEFKDKTGWQLKLPMHLSILFPNPPDSPNTQVQDNSTLQHAVRNLNLPQLLTEEEQAESRRAAIKAKKPIQTIRTNYDLKNPYHSIHSLTLSGYRVDKQTLTNLLDRTIQMRLLKCIVLKNTSLDDSYTPLLERLFSNLIVTRIDLSNNRLGPQFVSLVTKVLKEECHFEWIDLSRNPFSHNYSSCQALVSALGFATKLFHVCLDVHQRKQPELQMVDKQGKEMRKSQSQLKYKPKQNYISETSNLISTFFDLVRNRTNIHSFCPISTKINDAACKSLCQALDSKTNRLTCLNLSYCFIEQQQLSLLVKSLHKNNSLLKLDLTHNGLFDWAGEELLQALRTNKTLIDLNLSYNRLASKFGLALGKLLIHNSSLVRVDVSSNPIGQSAAQAILKSITDSNESLQYLGDLETCQKMSSQLIQRIGKTLRMNTLSKQFRNNLLKSKHVNEIEEEEIASAHTLAFLQAQSKNYVLLQPIEVTNSCQYDPFTFCQWKLV